MFRIRRIHDDYTKHNKQIVREIQLILKQQFEALSEDKIHAISEQLRNPVKYQLKSILFIADDTQGNVKGFAIVHHAPDLHFAYLDFIATSKGKTGRGIGGALYDSIRETSRQLDVTGLFFECLPDVHKLCNDKSAIKQNAARLKFYEAYGARPIINTAYETPATDTDCCPPHLLFDDLGSGKPLRKKQLKAIIGAILERKYSDICSPEYNQKVIDSVVDDPVQIRPYKYFKAGTVEKNSGVSPNLQIALVVNDKHDIHHIRERGYVESPVRINAILKQILPMNIFRTVPVKQYSDLHIRKVHHPEYVSYLKKVSKNVPVSKSIYPYVFPIRNDKRPPTDLPIRAGYFCIDTFTPINQNAYLAAKRAVDCTLTAAFKLLRGSDLAYSLVRPPGHHAEHRAFGGFCYFNSAAIAANYLSVNGNVAILDIDYHHGNGQQNIFYDRNDVLTVSIHGHPSFAYPYFSGFADEVGEKNGIGYNINFPLPELVDGEKYRNVLSKAIHKIKQFNPAWLVVALGLDTAKGDPTGTWHLGAEDFEHNGELIGLLGIPTLVVQEGGYLARTMGINARHFFKGLWAGYHGGSVSATGTKGGTR
ncbi:MAG: acetylpolyamine amidohydrolase [Deltaproteobacteria bacterium]|nr:acetylpolyamine amidohydrolase [Deltaproteobacteria bacterium]MBN2671374.1 acetylpolyamine amidohydrolase [Deltaproteobacteria bacterium]